MFIQAGTVKLFGWPMPMPGGAAQGFWPVVNQGQLAALYCFVWLYFSAAGPVPGASTRP